MEPVDEFTDIDLTEDEIDAMMAAGEPVELVAPPPVSACPACASSAGSSSQKPDIRVAPVRPPGWQTSEVSTSTV